MLEFDGTFLIAAISFIVFTFVMNVILYKPITRILGEREEFYDKNATTAKSTTSKTKAIIEDNNKKITSAQKEAQELVKTASNNAKVKKAQKIKDAEDTCGTRLVEVKGHLLEESKNAKAKLQEDIEVFVNEITTRVLGKKPNKIELDRNRIAGLLGDINV